MIPLLAWLLLLAGLVWVGEEDEDEIAASHYAGLDDDARAIVDYLNSRIEKEIDDGYDD